MLIKNTTETVKKQKFIRRIDLTSHHRLYIAFHAIFGTNWGTITQLSKDFSISRTFVYMLKSDLESYIYQTYEPVEREYIEKDIHLRGILSLRFMGKSSIPAISEILKYYNICPNSVGFISGFLNKLGSLLGNTVSNVQGCQQFVIYASDEIFSQNIPILITVDPISSAILQIDLVSKRDADSWKKHWQCLYKEDYLALYLVNDEGIAMESAQQESFSDLPRQSDTFHAISHRLGKWVDILERATLKAIKKEYNCEGLFLRAKSNSNMEKRINNYQDACKKTLDIMEIYEIFKFLYNCILSQLLVFDKQGKLIDKDFAQGEIETALELIRKLNIEKINKEISSIDNLIDCLFTYKTMAKTILNKIVSLYSYETEVVDFFSLAWQYQKQWRKSKDKKRTAYFKEKEKIVLELLKDYLKDDFDMIKNNIFKELEKIVQSSALVETINSIVRSFLNTSMNHVNQNMLNLIMFYHNNRVYRAGKRKGKSPIELLTGKKLEKHWIDILLEKWEEAKVKTNVVSCEFQV